MAVIVTRETQHERAFREGARDAQRAHHRFGPGAHEAQSLYRRHGTRDPLGQSHFVIVRRTENRAAFGEGIEIAHQRRMRVPEQERPVRHQIVDVRAPLAVVRICAATIGLHERLAADRRARAHGRTRTAGQRA